MKSRPMIVLLSALVLLLFAVFVNPAVAYTQETAIVAVSNDVALGVGDLLVIRVQGTHAVALNYSIPPGISVRVEEILGQDFRGTVTLGMTNLTHGRHICELLFYSSKPFNLTLSKYVRETGMIVFGSYQCPEGIPFRLVIPLIPRADQRSLDSWIAISFDLWSLEAWGIVAYAIFMPLFGLTAYFDLKDMKTRKAGRWSINDSVALVLRYMLYASMLSFAAVALVTLGALLYSLVTKFLININLGNLVISFILLTSLAVTYVIARWRGWYELVDEED